MRRPLAPPMRLAAPLLAAVLLAAPAVPPSDASADGAAPPGRPTVLEWALGRNGPTLDRALEEQLTSARPGEALEVIIQVRDTRVREHDLDLFLEMGLQRIIRYEIVPAVAAVATPRQVRRLAAHPRIRFIEPDSPLEPHLDRSTRTVKAEEGVWDRFIKDDEVIRLPVDGRGVSVAIIDSGVDATHPDLPYGATVVRNLKYVDPIGSHVPGPQEPHGRINEARGLWIDMPNTDTTSGHGTHIASTVAGTGAMSASNAGRNSAGVADATSRRGVAPGAGIVGFGAGEVLSIRYAMASFDWIYRHIRDDGNPLNIRVMNNSWGQPGGGSNPNPNSAAMQALMVLAYDMDAYVPGRGNQHIVFSAGNTGHQGGTTDHYGRLPATINVANALRRGERIHHTSSPGQTNRPWTYPDVAAPGTAIRAAAALTGPVVTAAGFLDSGEGLGPIMPYAGVTGTSMAAPHVAGVIALMLQANPDLGLAGVGADTDLPGGPQAPALYHDPFYNEISEAEWILKATATPTGYDPADPDDQAHLANHPSTVPELAGAPFLPEQGYGLVDAERAVAVALALGELRRTDPDATVADAVAVADLLLEDVAETYPGAIRLATGWYGTSLTWGTPARDHPAAYRLTVPAAWESLELTLRWTGVADLNLRLEYPTASPSTPGGAVPRSTCDLTDPASPATSGTKTVTLTASGGGPCPGIASAVPGEPDNPWRALMVANGLAPLVEWEVYAALEVGGDAAVGRNHTQGPPRRLDLDLRWGDWYPSQTGSPPPSGTPELTVAMRYYNLNALRTGTPVLWWLKEAAGGGSIKSDPDAATADPIGRVRPTSRLTVPGWLAAFSAPPTVS